MIDRMKSPPVQTRLPAPAEASVPAAGGWARQCEQWIAEYPGVVLGVALTCGVVLGWLIKRR